MVPVNRSNDTTPVREVTDDAGYSIFRDVPELVREYVNGTETLDYGCGLGRSTRLLRSFGLNVDAVDTDQRMIDRVKEKDPLGNYHVLRDGAIPSRSERYDFVFASFALVEIDDRKRLFDAVVEIARVTKRGGTFMAIVNREDTYVRDLLAGGNAKFVAEDEDVGSVLKSIRRPAFDYFWTDEDYRTAIENAGLTIERVHQPLVNTDKDDHSWSIEKLTSPVVIYVAQKL